MPRSPEAKRSFEVAPSPVERPSREQVRAAQQESLRQRKEEEEQREHGVRSIRSQLRSQSGRQEAGRQKAMKRYQDLGEKVNALTEELEKYNADPFEYFNEATGFKGKASRFFDKLFRPEKVKKFEEWKETYDEWEKTGKKYGLNATTTTYEADQARDEEGFDALTAKYDRTFEENALAGMKASVASEAVFHAGTGHEVGVEEMRTGIAKARKKEEKFAKRDIEKDFFKKGRRMDQETEIDEVVQEEVVESPQKMEQQRAVAIAEREEEKYAKREGKRVARAFQAEEAARMAREEAKKQAALLKFEEQKQLEIAQRAIEEAKERERIELEEAAKAAERANAEREQALARAHAAPEGVRKGKGKIDVVAKERASLEYQGKKQLQQAVGVIQETLDEFKNYKIDRPTAEQDLALAKQTLKKVEKLAPGLTEEIEIVRQSVRTLENALALDTMKREIAKLQFEVREETGKKNPNLAYFRNELDALKHDLSIVGSQDKASLKKELKDAQADIDAAYEELEVQEGIQKAYQEEKEKNRDFKDIAELAKAVEDNLHRMPLDMARQKADEFEDRLKYWLLEKDADTDDVNYKRAEKAINSLQDAITDKARGKKKTRNAA